MTGRPCSVCADPRRSDIEAAIVGGAEGFRAISRRYGIGRHALQRHARTHLRAELAAAESARKVRDAGQAVTLLDRLAQINADAGRLLSKAEAAADYRAAVGAVRELRGLIELEARLLGELRSGASVAVGVTVGAQEPEELELDDFQKRNLAIAVLAELPPRMRSEVGLRECPNCRGGRALVPSGGAPGNGRGDA